MLTGTPGELAESVHGAVCLFCYHTITDDPAVFFGGPGVSLIHALGQGVANDIRFALHPQCAMALGALLMHDATRALKLDTDAANQNRVTVQPCALERPPDAECRNPRFCFWCHEELEGFTPTMIGIASTFDLVDGPDRPPVGEHKCITAYLHPDCARLLMLFLSVAAHGSDGRAMGRDTPPEHGPIRNLYDIRTPKE